MYCKNCGTYLKELHLICPFCGNEAGLEEELERNPDLTWEIRYGLPDRKEDWEENRDTVSVFKWLLCITACFVPVLNLILVLYWSFSSRVPGSMRNWARAILILFALALTVLAGLLVAHLIVSASMTGII